MIFLAVLSIPVTTQMSCSWTHWSWSEPWSKMGDASIYQTTLQFR